MLVNLNRGYAAEIDDADAELVGRYNWNVLVGRRTFYAVAAISGKVVSMHRLIMGQPKGFVVDHKNGNGLDNKKENLRLATIRQNAQNSRKPNIVCKSIYKGVTSQEENCRSRMWRARILVNGKRIDLGYHATEIEAAKAYDDAARKYFKEFARVNFETELVSNSLAI